ncbi:MAG TPA: hypothetical protein VGL81_35505 [Polyangiaceae bacterium]|jgi:hypothetical protein
MGASERSAVAALSLACAACTFTGLGNYDVETCAAPVGTTTTIQQVGSLSSSAITFASDGASPIGAFPTQAGGGSCVQAVDSSGYVESSSCPFFVGLAPEQPWVIPLAGGHAAGAVLTTAPCTDGAIAFQFIGQSIGGGTQPPTTCGTGAALPSVAALAADGSTALVTWYSTALSTRSDPIQSCAAAKPAALLAAVVTGANTANPTLGTPVTLTSAGTSVRPASMAQVAGQSQVVVAAPDGNDVSVWLLDASLSTGTATTIPGLAGAYAASLGMATDGSGRIAVVAEIGCAPQTIALVGGTLSGGFSEAVIVAEADGAAAVQPTVAWVASESDWIVSWISAEGGPHVLARRFDAGGVARGDVIDPSTPATGASVASDGSLLAYVPGSTSFVSASLGCAE